MSYGVINHSIVPTATNAATSVTSGSINTTGANLIVLSISWWDGAGSGPPTVSDSKGNIYTKGTTYANGSLISVCLWYCANPVVGTGHTFTASGAHQYQDKTLGILALSGADISSPFDQSTGDADGTPGSLTPSANDCIVISAAVREYTTTLTLAGWNLQFQAGTDDLTKTAGLAYKIQTTATAENPSWGGTPSATLVASFRSTAETTPPTITAASVAESGARVVADMSEAVTATSAAGFSLLSNGDPLAVKLISSGETSQLLFEPARSILAGEVITWSYNSGTGDVEDLAGNALASFSNASVTNSSESTAAGPPGLAEFVDESYQTALFHIGLWASDAYNVGNAYGPTEGKALYEPWRFYRKMSAYRGGDSALDAGAVDAAATWIAALAALEGGAAVAQQILYYTDGLALEWQIAGNTSARDTIITHATHGAAADVTPLNYVQHAGASREAAYCNLAILNSELYCGQAHRARMEYLLNLALGEVDEEFEAIVTYGDGTETVILDDGTFAGHDPHPPGGHFEQVLGGIETDEDGEIVPGTENLHNFEFGGDDEGGAGWSPAIEGATSFWTLIQIYENAARINGGITPDVRIVPKMRRLLDALWQFYWVEEDQAIKYRWISTEGTPALNNFLAPCYWWFGKITGEARHIMRGDLLFFGTIGYESLTTRTGNPPAQYITKEFAELTRWIPDGWAYRAAAMRSGVAIMQPRCGLRLGVGF